jgi:hypothetical protein
MKNDNKMEALTLLKPCSMSSVFSVLKRSQLGGPFIFLGVLGVSKK